MLTTEEISTALTQVGDESSAEQIAKIIEQVDYRKSGKINYSEFMSATLDIQSTLTEGYLFTLFKHFDHDGNKQISYREFIESLRQEFAEKRLASVKYAYEVLSSEGPVTLAGLESRFKAEAHPRVRTRQKLAETVQTEFIEGLKGRAGEGEITE